MEKSPMARKFVTVRKKSVNIQQALAVIIAMTDTAERYRSVPKHTRKKLEQTGRLVIVDEGANGVGHIFTTDERSPTPGGKIFSLV